MTHDTATLVHVLVAFAPTYLLGFERKLRSVHDD
jgi:hypothetical protein